MSDRMTFTATITPTQIKVTATPLAPDVTAQELYDAEWKLGVELGEKWVALMRAMGVENYSMTNMRIAKDHEDVRKGE